MTRKQKRQRPAAGLEVVYADEHYSTVLVDDPESGEQHIRVYSQPQHAWPRPKLMFRLVREGLSLWCKRCRQAHLIPWASYDLWVQSPYATLLTCPLDAVEFGYALRDLTHHEVDLVDKMRSFINQGGFRPV